MSPPTLPSKPTSGGGPHRPLLLLSGLTGALSLALSAVLLPPTVGVSWTAAEQLAIAGGGFAVGGLVGLGSGVVVGAGSRSEAVASGLVPTLALLAIPWLPEVGTAKLQVPRPWLGMLVGAAWVALGLLRASRGASWMPVVATVLGGLWLGRLVPEWAASPPPPSGTRDILLVTVDTTRADRIPGFGGDTPVAAMPAMEAFSRQSRRYTQAYAPTALTGPSHASLLSGVPPHTHGVLANGRALPPLLPWVPKLLQAAGWTTRGFVSAAVLDGRLGFARGFDEFDSRFARRFLHGHPLLRVFPRRATGGSGFVRPDADTVSRACAAGLTSTADRPVFTWVHLYGPHWPYTPEPSHAEALGVAPTLGGGTGPIPLNLKSDLSAETIAHAKALYRAELSTLDDQLARLLASVDEQTVVVIVGDHGESLDEEGLLFNHGPLASAPSARVPLWIRAPELAAGVVETPVSIVDVAPTLLDLAGLETSVAGVSLRQPDPDRVVVTLASAEVFADARDVVSAPVLESVELGELASLAVRLGEWSRVGSIWAPPRWVHRATDPQEQLSSPPPPDATAQRLLDAWDGLVGRKGSPGLPPLDPAQQSVLEALGYLETAAEP